MFPYHMVSDPDRRLMLEAIRLMREAGVVNQSGGRCGR